LIFCSFIQLDLGQLQVNSVSDMNLVLAFYIINAHNSTRMYSEYGVQLIHKKINHFHCSNVVFILKYESLFVSCVDES
jgi:hypothetical protein